MLVGQDVVLEVGLLSTWPEHSGWTNSTIEAPILAEVEIRKYLFGRCGNICCFDSSLRYQYYPVFVQESA